MMKTKAEWVHPVHIRVGLQFFKEISVRIRVQSRRNRGIKSRSDLESWKVLDRNPGARIVLMNGGAQLPVFPSWHYHLG